MQIKNYIFFACIILIVYVMIWFFGTSHERQYLKIEINRSFGYHETKHWKRELIKLNLSIFPPLVAIYNFFDSSKKHLR